MAYTVYLVEFSQMVLVINSAFNMFAYNFHDDTIFDKIGLLWLVPLLAAIGMVILNIRCVRLF